MPITLTGCEGDWNVPVHNFTVHGLKRHAPWRGFYNYPTFSYVLSFFLQVIVIGLYSAGTGFIYLRAMLTSKCVFWAEMMVKLYLSVPMYCFSFFFSCWACLRKQRTDIGPPVISYVILSRKGHHSRAIHERWKCNLIYSTHLSMSSYLP